MFPNFNYYNYMSISNTYFELEFLSFPFGTSEHHVLNPVKEGLKPSSIVAESK